MPLFILSPEIEDYLQHFIKEGDPVHRDLISFSRTQSFQAGNKIIPFPIVGPLVGKALFQYAAMIKAVRVLELGSGFGYSAYWFAKALGKEGEIHLTDASQERLDAAKRILSKIPSCPRIHFHQGDALKTMDSLFGDFDIVFLDLDKEHYSQAFRKALPRIRKNGLLLADNVLWSGNVLNEKNPDAATKGIQEFNRLIFSENNLITTILPIRDGLAVCLKT